MRCRCISITMAKIKLLRMPSASKTVEKLDLSFPLVGMQSDAATPRHNLAASSQLSRHRMAEILLPGKGKLVCTRGRKFHGNFINDHPKMELIQMPFSRRMDKQTDWSIQWNVTQQQKEMNYWYTQQFGWISTALCGRKEVNRQALYSDSVWNSKSFLNLTSFLLHNVFEIHPNCSSIDRRVCFGWWISSES